ncbi:MAG: threonylcarbamoyl-AMP synthase [Eubacterium sp.]|nr:threonylcarbamoyl-AMP synthase [Eubacterium sp.]
MQTILKNTEDPSSIREASRILKEGGLVAFPTETVYGLGGNALDPSASARIYAAKGRPSDNPLIVHIAETSALEELAEEIPEKAHQLAEAFWPGPLTIILYKKKSVPDATTGGLSTVAIRMPSHPAALALIRESGVYIAAPSANKSGRPSPTTAQHVKEDLDGRIDMILDGGPVGIGIESTIVDLTEEIPMILRPGFITREMLSAVIGPVELDPTLAGITESENAPPCPTGNGAASPAGPQDLQHPKAPGMRYTHYAPKGELTIVSDRTTPERVTPAVKKRLQHLIREALDQGMITGIMTTGENAADYNIFKDDPHFRLILLGDTDNGQTVASHLYRALRECDDRGCERIYSENFRRDTFGSAIMNRLVKAAGHRIIYC